MTQRTILTTSYLRRPPLRVQLTALYAGLALAVVAAVLLATGQLYRTSARAAPGRDGAVAASSTHHFDAGPAIIGLAAVLIAVAVAWWLAGRFLRPLRAITTTAQEISATDLHRRLSLHGPDDELTELGRTLDDLFARLEASFESQRRFVANASHELRTPLAGQRTLLQVALADSKASTDGLRAACQDAISLGEQQERLINALLTLATGEKGIERQELFDLADIAASTLRSHQHEADRRGIAVHASLHPAPLTGDRALVERMIANLLDNAIRHNTPHGSITISTVRANNRPRLSVSNTGPVIDPEQLQRLFQPFQRLGVERTHTTDGHGLGLAIVKAVADAHGATLTVTARQEGGIEVTAVFPS